MSKDVLSPRKAQTAARRGVLSHQSSLIQKPFGAADLTNRVSELLAQPRRIDSSTTTYVRRQGKNTMGPRVGASAEIMAIA